MSITEEGSPQRSSMLFKEDEAVLCFHGPLLYEAKVLKAELWTEQSSEELGPHYYIHYKGWKNKWDEWVPEERVLKINEENLKRQADLKSNVEGKKGGPKVGPGAGVTPRSVEERAASKRKKEDQAAKEEEFIKRPEIKIPIPDALKVQLVDDWENITKNGKLVPLPRSPTIAQLLDLYRESIKSKKTVARDSRADDIVAEITEGLKQYFNRALGNVLLYRQERTQYQEQLRKLQQVHEGTAHSTGNSRNDIAGKTMADIYGAEHLLRLFVQMPNLIAHTNMDQDATEILKDHFVNILNFMARNMKELFLDYAALNNPSSQPVSNSSTASASPANVPPAGTVAAGEDVDMKDTATGPPA
ncbi:hypothetical protein SeLEV6574_g04461 [Synchytrium endobioticum]|uniref:Chromatin modification-related protein EAF3 n=1 Tax=Synchytrium endobioticum TaxID=286115 RepID=A0A507CZ72_9FUNG|nr:hypothetical protein SeLEV6574_g04461 [Synchytrium endobioticum]